MMRWLVVPCVLIVILAAATGVHGADSEGAWVPGQGVEEAQESEAARVAVVEAVNADPANFGGAYLAQDGTFVIQYVRSNSGRAAVEQKLRPGMEVRWDQVSTSRSDLARIATEIAGNRLKGVFWVSIDTINNRVKVKVGPTGSLGDVSSVLEADYGALVAVEKADEVIGALYSCTASVDPRKHCTRWRGGIEINSNIGSCTWGFNASRNGLLQLVTAGHCAAAGIKFSHDGVTIGSGGVGRNALNPATFGQLDVSRTTVTGAPYPTTQNTLYATSAYRSWTMTSVSGSGSYYVGQRTAKAGRTTDYTIGYVTDDFLLYQLTVENPGELPYYPACSEGSPATCPVVKGVATDVDSAAGDSGAPFFSWLPVSPSMQHTFQGILSGGNSTTTVFAPAADAAATLDLDFWCTTSGCP